MSTKQYNPKLVTMTFAAINLTGGFIDGDFITVTKMSPDATSKSGADGEVAVAISADDRHGVSLKLLTTSEANTLLSQLRRRARALGVLASGALQILDRNSGVLLFHAEHAWIAAPPGPARGKEVGDGEWKFETGDGDLDPSGTPSLP